MPIIGLSEEKSSARNRRAGIFAPQKHLGGLK